MNTPVFATSVYINEICCKACPIPKINKRFRFRCVVKASDSPKFWKELETVRKNYRSLNRTRTKFLVDPENLL